MYNNKLYCVRKIFEGCNFRGRLDFHGLDHLLSSMYNYYMHCNCFTEFQGFNFRGWQVIRKNSKNYVPQKFVHIQ